MSKNDDRKARLAFAKVMGQILLMNVLVAGVSVYITLQLCGC